MITVISSSPLDEQTKSQLDKKLFSRFGQRDIGYQVDPKLGMGLIIRYDSKEFYYNLQFELQKILHQLTA